jgi:hypothetical protein
MQSNNKLTLRGSWPLYLSIGMAVVVIVNVYMLLMAKKYFSPLVTTKSPYQDSLNYQNEINAELLFKQKNMQATFHFNETSKELILKLNHSENSTITNIKVVVLRANDKSLDSELHLSPQTNNKSVYSTLFTKAQSGLWYLKLTFQIDNHQYQYKTNLMI